MGRTEVGAHARLKNGLVVHDNLDDRREVYRLLERLPPRRRVQLLGWCAARCAVQKGNPLQVSAKTHRLAGEARWDDSADRRLTLETWTDLWMLASQYDLDMDWALARLVLMAKGK